MHEKVFFKIVFAESTQLIELRRFRKFQGGRKCLFLGGLEGFLGGFDDGRFWKNIPTSMLDKNLCRFSRHH